MRHERSGRSKRFWAGAGALALLAGAAEVQQVPALAKLTPGQWLLKDADGAGSRSICLTEPGSVLRLNHPGAQCSQIVIDSGPNSATVHYTCSGAGHGRSTVTVRTGSAFRLQTQGMAAGAPFDLAFDARRTGDCAAPSAPR